MLVSLGLTINSPPPPGHPTPMTTSVLPPQRIEPSIIKYNVSRRSTIFSGKTRQTSFSVANGPKSHFAANVFLSSQILCLYVIFNVYLSFCLFHFALTSYITSLACSTFLEDRLSLFQIITLITSSSPNFNSQLIFSSHKVHPKTNTITSQSKGIPNIRKLR